MQNGTSWKITEIFTSFPTRNFPTIPQRVIFLVISCTSVNFLSKFSYSLLKTAQVRKPPRYTWFSCKWKSNIHGIGQLGLGQICPYFSYFTQEVFFSMLRGIIKSRNKICPVTRSNPLSYLRVWEIWGKLFYLRYAKSTRRTLRLELFRFP